MLIFLVKKNKISTWQNLRGDALTYLPHEMFIPSPKSYVNFQWFPITTEVHLQVAVPSTAALWKEAMHHSKFQKVVIHSMVVVSSEFT